MVSGRLNAVCMASYFGRAAHPHASTTQNRLDDALDLKYLTAEQRAELFKLAESRHRRHHKVQYLRGRKDPPADPAPGS